MPDEGELTGTARDHWNTVWGKADPDRVSWFELCPEASLRLIETSGVGREAAVIDVGGGGSLFTRRLLEAGFQDLTVLDISPNGLAAARERLGPRVSEVEWVEADVRELDLSRKWDLWHDRAVFHFLTEPTDRAAYRQTLNRAVNPGGQVILATFGPQGPTRCSGLDVRRYSEDALSDELGPGFSLSDSCLELHATPGGATQQFLYTLYRRLV